MAGKTKRNIVVEKLASRHIEDIATEMVERKGIGHPDSIMDGMMEEVSRELCKYYIKKFGYILHHNTDKGQLSSGSSAPVFGGGSILSPINIVLSGQATDRAGNDEIPVSELAIQTARSYLNKAVPRMANFEGADFESRIVMGSTDLRDNFSRKIPGANDTSFGVGFAPFSRIEKLVYETELFLNSSKYKRKNPAVGEDIKVMGLRQGDRAVLTIAAALVSSELKSLEEYLACRQKILKDVAAFSKETSPLRTEVVVNNLDSSKRKSVYITVTGTSAEMGDAGAVGRGNRVNGLITPARPMSLEAAAGKNPVRHVGKIYNLLANEAAKAIVAEVPSIKECQVKLLSQIGRPIDDPLVAELQILSKREKEDFQLAKKILDRELADILSITQKVVSGKLSVF
ncbi:MAG: methionine adenosyltransferase [archaeon]